MLKQLSGRVTDGALAVAGKREGLVKLIEDDAIADQNSHLMKYHCISTSRKFMHRSFKNG